MHTGAVTKKPSYVFARATIPLPGASSGVLFATWSTARMRTDIGLCLVKIKSTLFPQLQVGKRFNQGSSNQQSVVTHESPRAVIQTEELSREKSLQSRGRLATP